MIIKGKFKKKETKEILKEKSCCIEKNGLFWCPELQWYLKEHCCFKNRRECDNFFTQTGKQKRI